MILTVSNLYPWPSQPDRGLFNAQLFRAMAHIAQVRNVCLVPRWRPWGRRAIGAWRDPFCDALATRYVPAWYLPAAGRGLNWRLYSLSLRCCDHLVSGSEAALACWLYPDAVAVLRLARRAGKPLWIRMHGSDRFHLRAAGRRGVTLDACRSAAGVVVNCGFMAREVIAAGVAAEKVHVVPNGVDSSLFRFRPREEAAGGLPAGLRPAAGDKVALFAGNLVAVKGPDIALEAWGRVADLAAREGIKARLVVIGAGDMDAALRRRAARLGVEGSVTFAGSRPHREVALWMNAADCLCLTSRSEGMPNVALEAVASGLPVVATDVGGVAELVGGGPEGLVVRAGGRDVAGRVAAALWDALRAPADRERMASRGARSHSWETQAERLIGLMRKGRTEAA